MIAFARMKLTKTRNFEKIKAGVIVNPRAGKVRSKYNGEHSFWKVLPNQENIKVTFSQTELQRAINEFMVKGMKFIITIGGDGTLHRVMTELIHQFGSQNLPVVLPLKGGTTNAVMSNMGLNDPPIKLLDLFIQSAVREIEDGFTMPLKSQRLLIIEDEFMDAPIYGFSFLNGIAYRIISEYFDNTNHSFMDAVKAGSRPLREWFLKSDRHNYFEPVQMKIEKAKENLINGQVNVVFATTLDRLILLYSPFRENLNGSDGYHCIINSMPIFKLFRYFVPLARGKIDIEGHFNQNLNEPINIDYANGYTLDGEIFHRDRAYKLRICPGPSFYYPDL